MPEAIDIKQQAQIIADYRSGDYSLHQLADKYKCNYGTIQKYCRDVEKGALKQEIAELIEKTAKSKMVEALAAINVNDGFIALKVKKLLESTDLKDVRAGIQEYAKFCDKYTGDDPGFDGSGAKKPQVHLYYPNNARHNS